MCLTQTTFFHRYKTVPKLVIFIVNIERMNRMTLSHLKYTLFS